MNAGYAILIGAVSLYLTSEHLRWLFFSYRLRQSALDVRLFHAITIQHIDYSNVDRAEIISPWRAIQMSFVPLRALLLTTRFAAPHVLVRKRRGIALILTPRRPDAFLRELEEKRDRAQKSPGA